MTSNFSINNIFEPILDINFTVDNGLFNTYGQTYILQHAVAIQNIKTLDTWEHIVLDTDSDNYFEIEYRWSSDTLTWSSWLPFVTDFNNFITTNIPENIWIQIKYKFITTNNWI